MDKDSSEGGCDIGIEVVRGSPVHLLESVNRLQTQLMTCLVVGADDLDDL